jgi:hypothetical protein
MSDMGMQDTFQGAAGAMFLRLPGLLLGLLMFGSCNAGQGAGPNPLAVAAGDRATPVRTKESQVWMTVGQRRFAVTLSDSAAARAFAEQLPLTLDMPDLNGNEKHVKLPKPLPTDASRPGTIRNGDLMLYGTDTFVVFYLTFESTYSYTRIGRVDDPAGCLARALGSRDVRVRFSTN